MSTVVASIVTVCSMRSAHNERHSLVTHTHTHTHTRQAVSVWGLRLTVGWGRGLVAKEVGQEEGLNESRLAKTRLA